MKTSLHDMFQTDSNKETKGVKLEYGTVSVWIARAGGKNKAFAKALEKETKPFRRQIMNNTMPDKTSNAILRRVYAKHIVLNWEGVVDQDGNPIPCTEENIIKVFEELPDFFIDIQEQSRNIALFQDEEIEEAAKN